jgi:sarcosine oxidase, subunit beta
MTRTHDAIVIGGGIHGCSAALFLARKGRRVVVLEKDHAARHASGVNSGGVRTLGRHLAELPLAVEARRCWQNLRALVGDDGGFRAVGNVRVAENAADFEKLLARCKAIEALGIDHREEVLDADALRRLVPAVAPHCVGGVQVAADGYAEPYRTSRAFCHAAAEAGAEIREGMEVLGADRAAGTWRVQTRAATFVAPNVVNCAGAWGDRIAQLLGDTIPLMPNGSMQFITQRLPRFVTPVVGSASRAFSLKQFENGTVLFGGGHRAPVVRDANRCDVDVHAIAKAATTAAALFPVLRDANIVRVWSGIEGFTQDGLPVIGHGREEGIFHAFGFSGHGFQLGPAVGALIAEALTSGATPVSIEAFAPARLQHSMRERHAA